MGRILRGVVFVLSLSGALSLVGAADAGTLIRESATTFRFSGSIAETNHIEISVGTVSGRFTFSDSLHPITLGLGAGDCTGGGTTTVTCPLVAWVFLGLGDGDDRNVIHDDVPMTVLVDGAEGNDTLAGGALGDTLVGGVGSDVLVGGGGADLLYGNTTSGAPDGVGDTVSYEDGRTTPVVTELAGGHQDADYYSDIQHLTGGSGDDLLVGDVGPNVLIGSGGADILVGADGMDDLRGGLSNGAPDGSLDIVSYRERGEPVLATLGGITPDGDLFSDIGGLEGGGAGDMLTGDAGPNLLLGGAGNDSLHGGRGSDDFLAGEGEDSIEAEDGERDTVNCGPGVDIHAGDPVDTLVDCEAETSTRHPAAVRCVVPNVKTMTVAGARRLLRARHCSLGQVRRVYSGKVRRGWIVSQSRRPGARLPRNAKVNIVVSRGRRR